MTQMTYLPTADVKPYPGNPRINDKAVAPVAASIKEFGFQQPIVVDKDNVVIVGHTRLLAAKSLGMAEVPVLVAKDLTPEQVKAYRLADNRTNQNAEWDTGLLVDELLSLQESGTDLALTAFTEAEIKDLLNETPPATPGSLGESFLVPPFSILQGGNPTWLARKKQWTESLNLRSGESREHVKVLPAMMKLGSKTFQNTGVSVFDPVLAEVLVSWFSAPGDTVIDNYAGGSVRGAMCAALGRHYTGIDIRPAQVEANKIWYAENADKHEVMTKHPPTWLVGDGTLPDEVAPGQYDFSLTCPPYGDLEVYSQLTDDISNKGYAEFRDLYFRGVKRLYSLMKDNTFACIVVGEFRKDNGAYNNFVGDTITAYLEAGFEYYNEIIYATPVGSLVLRARRPFTATRKIGKTHQNVLVFGKALNKTLVLPEHQNVLVFTKGDVKKTNAVVKNIFSSADPETEGAEVSDTDE